MIHYKNYHGHYAKLEGERKQVDNTVYTFDIETTSYIILDGKVKPAVEYQYMPKEIQELCEYRACMYIWTFGIDDNVFYGRTWKEFKIFLDKLEYFNPHTKYVFVHNLAFEFQFLKSVFNFTNVMARKSHKVMSCDMMDYNIQFRCSYFMSNCALKELPKQFQLPVEKKVGDLDYSKLRTYKTKLSVKEMGYCEYDCLVVYYYILRELETYKRVDKIPLTSTGHVRRELRDKIQKDWNYRGKVKKAINTNPHVYNLLVESFMGGYTHANWIYTNEILEKIDSWDFTSSYPYVMVTNKFPSSEFIKCNIKKVEQMSKRLCYLLKVKFINIKCKYYNNFISQSKCKNIYRSEDMIMVE